MNVIINPVKRCHTVTKNCLTQWTELRIEAMPFSLLGSDFQRIAHLYEIDL